MTFIISALAAALVGLSKCGINGAAILSVPLLMTVYPAKASVGLILPVLIFGDLIAVTVYRRTVQWRIIGRILPYTLAGIIAGYFLLDVIDDDLLKRGIGVLIIILIALKWTSGRYNLERFTAGAYIAPVLGILAGIATMMANAAGPLMAVYLLWMGIRKEEFIGTGAWYFFILNCIKVPFMVHLGMITGTSSLYGLKLLPFVALGSLGAVLLVKRINQTLFERMVMVLAVAAGVKLLF